MVTSLKSVCLCSSPFSAGMDNNPAGNPETVTEAGWYILGEDQQHVGPYAFSELRGEFYELNNTFLHIADLYCSRRQF